MRGVLLGIMSGQASLGLSRPFLLAPTAALAGGSSGQRSLLRSPPPALCQALARARRAKLSAGGFPGDVWRGIPAPSSGQTFPPAANQRPGCPGRWGWGREGGGGGAPQGRRAGRGACQRAARGHWARGGRLPFPLGNPAAFGLVLRVQRGGRLARLALPSRRRPTCETGRLKKERKGGGKAVSFRHGEERGGNGRDQNKPTGGGGGARPPSSRLQGFPAKAFPMAACLPTPSPRQKKTLGRDWMSLFSGRACKSYFSQLLDSSGGDAGGAFEGVGGGKEKGWRHNCVSTILAPPVGVHDTPRAALLPSLASLSGVPAEGDDIRYRVSSWPCVSPQQAKFVWQLIWQLHKPAQGISPPEGGRP